ncbi:MAG: hypothetical protein E7279_02330 [Lachnospiraceae bacterium]|nr:hypothetical protein [Lachnospiraceae bacterium]
MSKNYLSIGFTIVFFSQLLDIVIKSIGTVLFQNEVGFIYNIAISVTTIIEIVGIIIAKKQYEKAKRAIPILIVQIVAIMALQLLNTYGDIYSNGAIGCAEIIFDSVSILTIISIVKEVHEEQDLPVKFMKTTSLVVVINTVLGMLATLWSNALVEGDMSANVVITILIFLALFTEIMSYILFLIVIFKAIKLKNVAVA